VSTVPVSEQSSPKATSFDRCGLDYLRSFRTLQSVRSAASVSQSGNGLSSGFFPLRNLQPGHFRLFNRGWKELIGSHFVRSLDQAVLHTTPPDLVDNSWRSSRPLIAASYHQTPANQASLLGVTKPRKPHECLKSSSNTPPTELSTDKMVAWHPGQGTSNGPEAIAESRKSMVFTGFGKCALMYHLLSVMIVTDQGSEVKSRRFDADLVLRLPVPHRPRQSSEKSFG
jgi:hypothetical protein